MKSTTTTIFHIFLLVLLYTASVYSFDIPERHKDIENKILNNQYPQCIFDLNIQQCELTDNILRCPSITECSDKLAEMNVKNFVGIVIPAGTYNESHCPFKINPTLFSHGEVILSSVNGTAYFNCNTKRFLFLNVQNSVPVQLVLIGISINGYSRDNGGCISVMATLNEMSAIYIYNTTGDTCVSDSNGGFLYTNVGNVILGNTTVQNSYAGVDGGGIYAQYASVTLYYSTFTNNNANGDSFNGFGNGGAIASNVATSYQSSFSQNKAQGNGGVFNVDNVYIYNSTFFGNSGTFGGVSNVYLPNGITVVDHSIFQYNQATGGGALYGGNSTVSNSLFTDNSVNDYNILVDGGTGGAIFATKGDYSHDQATFTIYNTQFYKNGAVFGGAIGAIDINLNITNCSFIGNIVNDDPYSTSGGGAIYTRAAMFSQDVNVTYSSFIQNLATDRGAIYSINKRSPFSLNLKGTEFIENSASSYAGGIYFKQIPANFKGGVFKNSKSSESTSMTFWSKSISNVNTVSFSNILPYYNVPIYDEVSFRYWKVLGAQGNCTNGVATINENGVVLSCQST